MNFIDLAKSRYSCRKFSTRLVENEKIDKIIEAGLLAPTGINAQPFKIWKIESEEYINKVAQATPFTFGARTILAVGADKTQAYNRKFDDKNFAEIDAVIVATHMMLEVQELGLGTTWVGHFDPKILKAQIPQMKDYEIVGLFPIGYPAEDVKPSEKHFQRKAKEEVVTIL